MTEPAIESVGTFRARARRSLATVHARYRGVWPWAGVIGLFILASFASPLPYDPLAPDAFATLQEPSAQHWFGTDRSGSDVFSRTVAAGRIDLTLAVLGAGLSLLAGVPIGLLASTAGRWGERLMRGLDMFQAFPLVVLAIAIVSLTGNRIENIVVAIALINVPRFIRLVRSEALSLRESRFIEAAHAIGATRSRVMFRHLLPNVMGVILAQASLAVAHAIVVIAALSFLGIGIRPPTPSWGTMIRSGADNMATGQWWIALFPGLAVFVSVYCFNRIADAMQAQLSRSR